MLPPGGPPPLLPPTRDPAGWHGRLLPPGLCPFPGDRTRPPGHLQWQSDPGPGWLLPPDVCQPGLLYPGIPGPGPVCRLGRQRSLEITVAQTHVAQGLGGAQEGDLPSPTIPQGHRGGQSPPRGVRGLGRAGSSCSERPLPVPRPRSPLRCPGPAPPLPLPPPHHRPGVRELPPVPPRPALAARHAQAPPPLPA